MELKGVHYDAFISYRHAPHDSFVATNLHKKLEGFKLPKSVKKSTSKKRIERVFRDEDELPLSDNLSDPINNALLSSDFLIVIATPRYLESRWCQKEIETFLQTHARDHVLIVLAEGEPAESFPPILMYEDVQVVDAAGNLITRRETREPLGADTRGKNKKEILKAMDTAVIKIAAAIFGLDYDDLKQRHREAKMKRMIGIVASVAGVFLAFSIFALIMLMRISVQNKQIKEQNATIVAQSEEISDKYAGSMVGAAKELMALGRYKDAIYALRNVMPDSPSDGYNSNAYSMLSQLMGAYSVDREYLPIQIYEANSEIYSMCESYNNKFIALEEIDGTLNVFDVETGERIYITEHAPSSWTLDYAFCGFDGFVYSDGNQITYVNLTDLTTSKVCDAGSATAIYAAPEGTVTICITDDYIYGIDTKGSVLYKIDMTTTFYIKNWDIYGLEVLDIDYYGNNFVIAVTDNFYNYLMVADITNGNVIISFFDEACYSTKVAMNGKLVFFTTDGSEYFSTKCYALNISTGKTMWIKEMNDVYCNDILVNDNSNVYIQDVSTVIELDKQYGTALNYFVTSDTLLCSYLNTSGEMFYVDTTGGIFRIIGSNMVDCTYTYFRYEPGDHIMMAHHSNDQLYYQYKNSNYVVCYSFSDDYFESIDYSGSEYSKGKEATDDVNDLKGIDRDLIYSAIYSDNGEYMLITYGDNTVFIYETGKTKPAKVIYDLDYQYESMVYIDELDCYVLNSYVYSVILDKDFNLLGIIRKVVACDGDCFIVKESNTLYYQVPFKSYKEVLEMADDFLGNYKPNERIMSKYSISDAD